MRFTNVVLMSALSVLSLANSQESENLLYSGTRICSKHKSTMCLSYDYDSELVVLDKRHRLRFDIETIERINMQLNRVYTYAKDPSTKKKVKSCLIKKEINEYGVTGVGLAPCDVDDNELVLAVESGLYTSIDEFVLKQIGEATGSLCLTTTHAENGELVPSQKKSQLRRSSPIVLDTCELDYAQEFKARSFDVSASSRMISTEAPEVQAYIGKYCLAEQPDLCLGVSLEDGTNLVNDVFMQVKNYTKNEAKDLHDLKMRWYHDLENNRIASAANMSLCVEALYGASVGHNRAGTEIFDDVTHLGACDPVSRVITADEPTQLPASEHFYANEVITATEAYIELRTIVPESAKRNSTAEKCISIVKCVVHDSGRCTPYNSVPVYEAKDLQQGAYARLKDCNSKELVSQRWYYVRDDVVTVPPTNYPTPKPATVAPTPAPTPKPTAQPTPNPTIATEPLPPTDGDSGSTDDDDTVNKSNGKAGLAAGLALVGVLCFAVIVMGIAYYYKHRNEFQNLPEEDENFIARV